MPSSHPALANINLGTYLCRNSDYAKSNPAIRKSSAKVEKKSEFIIPS